VTDPELDAAKDGLVKMVGREGIVELYRHLLEGRDKPGEAWVHGEFRFRAGSLKHSAFWVKSQIGRRESRDPQRVA